MSELVIGILVVGLIGVLLLLASLGRDTERKEMRRAARQWQEDKQRHMR